MDHAAKIAVINYEIIRILNNERINFNKFLQVYQLVYCCTNNKETINNLKMMIETTLHKHKDQLTLDKFNQICNMTAYLEREGFRFNYDDYINS